MDSPDKNYYIIKSIEELKVEQKEAHIKHEALTKEFYRVLKDHMDNEDERWQHVLDNLESLKLNHAELKHKVGNHSNVLNKLWIVVVPIIVSILTSYLAF